MRYAVAIVLFAACRGGAHPAGAGVPGQLRAELGKQLGVAVDRVDCAPPDPAGGDACTATVAGVALPIKVTQAADGSHSWEVAAPIVETAPLVSYVQDELAELGVVVHPDCGPPVQLAAPGDRLECSLGTGRAWARLGDDGDFTLEVALDPAVVAARSALGDDAELDRLSHGLAASDGAGGGESGDDDDDAP